MASGLIRWASLPASTVLISVPSAAQAVARTPTISGNVWVAYAIIAVLIATIYLLIMGTLHVERRDARLGRSRRDDGWFGIFPTGTADDEDSPDFHHHGGGDGGEGGEGGEGGWG